MATNNSCHSIQVMIDTQAMVTLNISDFVLISGDCRHISKNSNGSYAIKDIRTLSYPDEEDETLPYLTVVCPHSDGTVTKIAVDRDSHQSFFSFSASHGTHRTYHVTNELSEEQVKHILEEYPTTPHCVGKRISDIL